MNFRDYLHANQKIVYETFSSAIRNHRLSHAYLIKGNEGAPLLETAEFLAKSLLCPHADPFACEECMTCIRFDEGNFADFRLLNGQKSNIRVSDIEDLQNFFQNTPSEKSGKMIYIIHLLENSNRESLNALLKFLEEPQENVYAFITTQNEEKLLPTILSRTQHLKLLPLPHDTLIQEAQNRGISLDDAELLSQFYGNIDTLSETASGDLYPKIKQSVFDTLEAMVSSKEEALFFIESTVVPALKDKVGLRMYLDILSSALKDALNVRMGLPPAIPSQSALWEELKEKYPNIESIYREVMLTRGKIELNVNPGLLLEHLFIFINKGGTQ